ncbi:MAG: hypothetical protein AAF715_14490 [Myxococcota bacterium]
MGCPSDDVSVDSFAEPACPSATLRLGQIYPEEAAVVVSEVCFSRDLRPDAEGRVSCAVLVTTSASEAGCSCEGPGQSVPSPALLAEANAASMRAPEEICVCALEPFTDAALTACRNEFDDEALTASQGWCYLDRASVPPLGDPELTQHCGFADDRALRFVVDVEADGATLLALCEVPAACADG